MNKFLLGVQRENKNIFKNEYVDQEIWIFLR